LLNLTLTEERSMINQSNNILGVVHKRRPQSERRGFVQFGHFADKGGRGFFRCGRPYFLAQKPSNFSKFMVCSHGQGERGNCPVQTFFGKVGKGSIFRDFVRTSFMDGFLRYQHAVNLIKSYKNIPYRGRCFYSF